MKVTPPSAARSRTDPAAASSICRPKVMVPRQSLETFRPVRPSLACSMAAPSVGGVDLKVCETVVDVGVPDEKVESDSGAAGVEHVVGGRDHLDAVDEPFEEVAVNRCLYHVAVLDAVLRADQLLQRGEVSDLPV